MQNEQNNIDLNQLSPDQQQALMAQLEAKQKADADKRNNEIESYKTLQDDLLSETVPLLLGFHQKQSEMVGTVFKQFETLIQLKLGLYGVKGNQDSHTFSHRDGSSSLRLGYNVIMGFDGTESAGIEKIKEYLRSLAGDDENRTILTGLLNTFMKPDKEGKLNPVRIKELSNWKDKIPDAGFKEGIEIIEKAQIRTRTSEYVRGWAMVEDKEGKQVKVNFSISVERNS